MDFVRQYAVERLRQYAGRLEVCLGKLSDEQIWMRHSPSENAAGNLVLHLCGNVRQWIGYGVAGLPDARDRDAEFAARSGMAAAELKVLLASAIRTATAQIEELPENRLGEMVEIQAYRVSRLEAILHVLTHFAEHTGQIIFITKLLTGGDLGFYSHLKKPAHSETLP